MGSQEILSCPFFVMCSRPMEWGKCMGMDQKRRNRLITAVSFTGS